MIEKINYIKQRMNDTNSSSISIHTGKIPANELSELEKHFIVKKEFFGYTMFTIKTI